MVYGKGNGKVSVTLFHEYGRSCSKRFKYLQKKKNLTMLMTNVYTSVFSFNTCRRTSFVIDGEFLQATFFLVGPHHRQNEKKLFLPSHLPLTPHPRHCEELFGWKGFWNVNWHTLFLQAKPYMLQLFPR